MLKPLTKEQTDKLLETAILHFGENGFAGANINKIAGDAGVSVGVVYKYYKDKKDLFLACVDKSLEFLDSVFEHTRQQGGTLIEMIEDLIRQSQVAAHEHPEYFRLYHQITVSVDSDDAPEEAPRMIESSAARMYRQLISEAKEAGHVRADLDSGMFAFFFDNLLMMLHFSYACKYYHERLKVFCGEDIDSHDEKVRQQMLKFITGALGLEQPE